LIHISKTHIVAFLLIAASLLFGQNGDLQNRFNQGLVFYQNNDLTQAQYIFSELCDSSSDNPLVTSALLMAAKTSYSLREYDQAISYCTRLIKDYEASRYRAHAYYVRGAAYFRDGNFGTAAQELTFAVEFAESEKLLKLAESTATNIVVGYIGKSTLNKIYSAYPWKQAHPILTIWRAHFARQTGDEGTAEQMLQTLLASNPAPRYKIIAQQLSAGETAQNKHVVRIGIIQPLAGYFSEEANDFLKGMAFSLHKRKNMQSVIELVLKETDGSIVETIKAAQQLLDDNVDLVITGLEGQKSAAAAGILQQANIPVIIPVATDNNLVQLGEYIFQANSDMETRGTRLAEYASNTLKMKSFATLAPADDYGNALTDAFANTVDQLGGTIVSQQWYYPGTSDFSRQLKSIREASFRFAYRDSLRAWGMDVNMARIDSIYARLDRNVRMDSDDNEGLTDFTDIAVRSIDGFFLPIYEEDIPYIASQFALYNIKARLLGGDSWNNADLLRNQQRYVNGVLFFAGHHVNEADIKYINFIRDFRIATSSSPGTMAIYGFNIMNMLLDGIEHGQTNAHDIAAYLKSLELYKGLGTNISFQKTRVNSAVNLLQFQDGNIYRVTTAE